MSWLEPFRDSVVLVTGASSGIGRATALAFAHGGAHVAVAARRKALLDELAAQAGRDVLVLPRTHRTLETAKASDAQWGADAMNRFHALEKSYREIQLAWHTFAIDSVLQKSRDVLKLAKLLDEEAAIKTKAHQRP